MQLKYFNKQHKEPKHKTKKKSRRTFLKENSSM